MRMIYMDGEEKEAPEGIFGAPVTAPVALPAPPCLAAAGFNLRAIDYAVQGVDGGYNLGGAIYFDAGSFMLFFINPIEGAYEAVFMASGGHVMTATDKSEYGMTVETRLGGIPADAEQFSVQVFKT